MPCTPMNGRGVALCTDEECVDIASRAPPRAQGALWPVVLPLDVLLGDEQAADERAAAADHGGDGDVAVGSLFVSLLGDEAAPGAEDDARRRPRAPAGRRLPRDRPRRRHLRHRGGLGRVRAGGEGGGPVRVRCRRRAAPAPAQRCSRCCRSSAAQPDGEGALVRVRLGAVTPIFAPRCATCTRSSRRAGRRRRARSACSPTLRRAHRPLDRRLDPPPSRWRGRSLAPSGRRRRAVRRGKLAQGTTLTGSTTRTGGGDEGAQQRPPGHPRSATRCAASSSCRLHRRLRHADDAARRDGRARHRRLVLPMARPRRSARRRRCSREVATALPLKVDAEKKVE